MTSEIGVMMNDEKEYAKDDLYISVLKKLYGLGMPANILQRAARYAAKH